MHNGISNEVSGPQGFVNIILMAVHGYFGFVPLLYLLKSIVFLVIVGKYYSYTSTMGS